MADTSRYDKSLVAELMALADTYADTACVNGIRSAWAQMARTALEVELMKRATQAAKHGENQ